MHYRFKHYRTFFYRMEPSLRSSSVKSTECKLKRTDPVLHETIQRFVENLSDDMRISQYADIHFAIKQLENRRWYFLSPNGLTGYLVCLPNLPIVWIDEQFKRSFKIQMRVSKSVYEKNSIMIASLNIGDSLLRIEDVWLLAGKMIRGTPFTQRLDNLHEFFTLQYKFDSLLQQGLRIDLATYKSLNEIKDLEHFPNMLVVQGEDNKRRLRIQIPKGFSAASATAASATAVKTPAAAAVKTLSATAVKTPAAAAASAATAVKTPAAAAASAATAVKTPAAAAQTKVAVSKKEIPVTNSLKPEEAIAIPHPEYPDTYELLVNGVKKGYAAIQDIELSKRLRSFTQKEIRVKIEWNSEFSMYEICDII